MNLLFILTFLVFGGCAVTHHEIKVLKSKTEITVHTLDVNKGDVIACDNERCKVVQP